MTKEMRNGIICGKALELRKFNFIEESEGT